MSDRDLENISGTASPPQGGTLSQWSKKYGAKHAWQRIKCFPSGVAPPTRVRVYRRHNYFLLQWWQSTQKKNVSERVEGDLVTAIVRAREIEEQLLHFKTGVKKHRQIWHQELIESFVADLTRRSDAGEIDPRTVTRYQSALAHYLSFVEQSQVQSRFPSASNINRDFALEFRAFLKNLRIAPNGHANSQKRPIGAPDYVESVVRSMLQWAADPDRGDLIPDGFRNPFRGQRRRDDVAPDPFGEPDITVEMAAKFLSVCDAFQLRLFSVLVFYGLRASEPCFLFRQHCVDDWLSVACNPLLGYLTKGRRDKRFPLLPCVNTLLTQNSSAQPEGLLFVRRPVHAGQENPPLLGKSLEALQEEFQRRCSSQSNLTAKARRQLRDAVLQEAGGLKYDHIQHEFQRVSKGLGWPPTATLKDFRHLFSTELQNAGMPELYRRYLMGHAPGKAAIVTYSHLNQLRERYEESVERSFAPLVHAVGQRVLDLESIEGDRNTEFCDKDQHGE